MLEIIKKKGWARGWEGEKQLESSLSFTRADIASPGSTEPELVIFVAVDQTVRPCRQRET